MIVSLLPIVVAVAATIVVVVVVVLVLVLIILLLLLRLCFADSNGNTFKDRQGARRQQIVAQHALGQGGTFQCG